jgi:hypothetical protein
MIDLDVGGAILWAGENLGHNGRAASDKAASRTLARHPTHW